MLYLNVFNTRIVGFYFIEYEQHTDGKAMLICVQLRKISLGTDGYARGCCKCFEVWQHVSPMSICGKWVGNYTRLCVFRPDVNLGWV